MIEIHCAVGLERKRNVIARNLRIQTSLIAGFSRLIVYNNQFPFEFRKWL